MADYYPPRHSCGGNIDIYPAGHGLCTECGARIDPVSEPDPAWDGKYTVITVPVIPHPIRAAVRVLNASQQIVRSTGDASRGDKSNPLEEILREIDEQNEEGRRRAAD